MDVRFEDHPQFQRAAALAALGGGALSAVWPQPGLVQAAVMGGALLLAVAPPLGRQRIAAALLCLLAAGGSLLIARSGWLVLLSGALLGVLFALGRRASAKASGTAEPSRGKVALCAALGAGAVEIGRAHV